MHPKSALLFLFLFLWFGLQAEQPNIVILLTDDQGYGDLGYTGNPDIKTPAIDAFAAQSIVFENFYVSPVCTPTRASLLTGRYNYRTGAIDTWMGRSTMHQDEITLAEVLSDAGYATGLFGKWHLGDTYPYRPQDQGFDEVLMHLGGGIGQPSGPIGNSYFDPVLWENGVEKTFSGYCMDIYTDATLRFIEQNKNRPFFAYLATNTPHTPLEVDASYSQPYIDAGLPEETSIIYGMMTNIDDNFARVLSKLEELQIAENTIVIFMSDNGPKIFHPEHRYPAGLRGEKTGVYEGGIRSPFFMRWPARFESHQTLLTRVAHIDLMPSLLSALEISDDPYYFDGRDFMPLIQGDDSGWGPRSIFLQWNRGNLPETYRNFTVVGERFKLLQTNNKFDTSLPQQFELYDLKNDPGETRDLAGEYPEMVETLKASYNAWLDDVSRDRGYPEMPTWLGSARENPILLTHQDRRNSPKWGRDTYYEYAYWPINIITDGNYTAKLTLFEPLNQDATATVRIGNLIFEAPAAKDKRHINVPIGKLPTGLESATAWVSGGMQIQSPRFLRLQLLEEN